MRKLEKRIVIAMGNIIVSSEFFYKNQEGLLKPIIYCCSYENFEQESVSISLELSKELKKINPNRRTMQLEKCFCKVISDLPNDVVIKDIDVMFNPAYEVDILKLLIAAYKKKSFRVIWPGTYIDGKLIYAEEGYLDYKVYNICDYDITCII